MSTLPASLEGHRVAVTDPAVVCEGRVRWAPVKSLWFLSMLGLAVVGGALTFSWPALALYVVSTMAVLLLGHSLGSHRKLVHDSYAVSAAGSNTPSSTCGVHVGLAGPHRPRCASTTCATSRSDCHECHDYLRHGRPVRGATPAGSSCCELRPRARPAHRGANRAANRRPIGFYRWPRAHLDGAAHSLWPFFSIWSGGWAFVCFGVCARVTAVSVRALD